MKATELRLGNYIYGITRRGEVHLPPEVPLKVLQIELFNCEVLPYDENPAQKESYFKLSHADTSAIPLTQEWLERLGFEKNEYPLSSQKVHGWLYSYTKRTGRDNGHLNEMIDVHAPAVELCNWGDVQAGEFYCNFCKVRLKFVHQLQNLYFALTNTELTVK